MISLAFAAFAAACAGPHSTLPIAGTNEPPPAIQASSSTLTIALSISKPFLNGKQFKLFAYPLTLRGPAAQPPARSLRLTTNVGPGSAACSTNGRTRTCTLSAQVPARRVGIVAQLLTGNRILARSFTQVTVRAPTTLDIDAGTVEISSLSIAAPLVVANGRFNVGVTPLATDGATIMIGHRRSVVVNVYGPPGAVPSPQATVSVDGATAPFALGRTSFVNPMTVAAVMGTMSNTAQIFPKRAAPMACAPLSNTPVFVVAEPKIPSGFGLQASVAGSNPVGVGLDTGSTTFAIARSKLSGVQMSEFVGPGQYAQQTYEPSGTTIEGNYYLAPVTLYQPSFDGGSPIAKTVPMEVLVTSLTCAKDQPCVTDTGTAYMGIGYGRPTNGPGWMSAPLESAVMQLQPIAQGTMHPGFVLTANSLTIGVNSASVAAFSSPMVQLSPYPNRPGDWNGPQACISFNGSTSFQCGRMLLDIGIDSMFVNAVRPSPVTSVQIVSPQQYTPVLNYSFAYPVSAGATPPAPNPSASPPIVFEVPSPPAFINTGRNALAATNYLYDAGCGEVGFAAQ